VTDDEQTHRDNMALALRAIADRICDDPDFPVPHSVDYLTTFGGDAASVDRVAAVIGATPAWVRGGHYSAAAHFGPVDVRCVAIPDDVMAEHAEGQKVLAEWRERRAADPNICPRCKQKPKHGDMGGCWDCIGICHEGDADHACPICTDDTNA
jgi:hypothetical protein